MKTKFYFLALAAVAVIASSCSGTMSVTAYNEAIVAMHSESTAVLTEKMEQIFDTESTSKEEAQTLVDELTTVYDNNITKLNEMKYPKAAATWHQSVIDLNVYIKDNVLPLFSETFNHEPESQEWYDAWNNIDERINGDASDLEDIVIEEQAKFAVEVGRELTK